MEKIEEHMVNVMGKAIYEEGLTQRIEIHNKQLKSAVTMLSGYNGIFIVTNKNDKFYFPKSIIDKDGFIQITIPFGC